MVLPEDLNRQALIGNILLECSELEIMITDPSIMKESLTYWSVSQLPIWQKLLATTQFEYNPIWNKDGVITEERTHSHSDTEERDLASAAETTGTGQVSAYNSSAFQNANKSVTEGTGSDTGTIEHSASDHDTYERIEKGNIGITTTQQMIKEEREVSQFDIYKYIVESFKSMYCLGVY
jgi:hypothetical protein